ncbi:hypothetical protein BC830DRAFT_1118410 [Chytriomyces sp. MP71]|nr:hypothetical protein BC830DRAFT_1118410 [Chytriomyces sp. MP71]
MLRRQLTALRAFPSAFTSTFTARSIRHSLAPVATATLTPFANFQQKRTYHRGQQEAEAPLNPPTPILLLAGGYLAVINAVAVGMFWYDKNQANNKGWRVPEKQLQLTALLGGWVGGEGSFLSSIAEEPDGAMTGLWAMKTFRHKTVKKAFQEPYNLAMYANMIIMGGIGAAWVAMPRFRRSLQGKARSLGF